MYLTIDKLALKTHPMLENLIWLGIREFLGTFETPFF